ncbi:MAG: filamentous hemagglutinin family protein [Sandarakinorhabdus sp.]|nr:filamentous hemagglutinin family protein [Sandarakinorhabdus sp.]
MVLLTPRRGWGGGARLTLGGGGSTGGARILADGGAPQAEGGVLTWLNPVLRQTDAPGQATNVVSADQITNAGFDTFIAQNRLTTLGNATLKLGRGFYLTARPFDGNSSGLDSYRTVLATGGNLLIDAPYIHLESPQQTVRPDSAAAANAGRVALNGQTIDIVGSIYADASVTSLTLNAVGDVRLSGVQPAILTLVGSSNLPVAAGLGGQFVVNGDLTINAAQVYPTTGTGSLQQDINAQRAGTTGSAAPYLLASTGADATITIGRSGTATPSTPFSAGGNLLVQAAKIVQQGVLRVPLGRLVLGSNAPLTIGSSLVSGVVPATKTVTIGAASVTSVSANGLNIPYGTTTDLIEYFFTPTSDGRLFAPPAAELRLAGDSVDVRSGAVVDASGGGDLYAYEFAAGVGGSRDVLSRFNSDSFSGNTGLQFADGRQVYAIVPSLGLAGAAPIDPIYSSDYAALYSSSDAGRSVYLEAAPGLVAGWYTLLPARYALLPGGMRVVENSGDAPPAIGQSTQLRDGSLVVGGHYGVTGTGIESSQRRTFTVQNQQTIKAFSNIQLTQASATFADLATRDGLAVPRLPVDAARLVLAPLTALSINTRFLTAAGTGGRGAQVDISGNAFEIVVPGAAASPSGTIRLTTTDFSNLNAASLLIGGVRTENSNGTTSILATSKSILVANNAANPLSAPEVLLVVDGTGSTINVADGAVITASGSLNGANLGNYIITASTDTGQTGIGGIVRVANGGQRLIDRPGSLALANSLEDTSISIGEATLSGQSILLDNSRDLVITDNPLTTSRPLITASANLAIGGDDIHFTTAPSGFRGLVITPDLEAQFAAADRLTISTRSIIAFSGGTHVFKDLVIDARGIRPYGQAITPPPAPRDNQFDVAVADPAAPINVTINARNFSFSNSDIARTPCSGTATVTACGSTGNTLAINAATISFGSGDIGAFGFDRNVMLTASQGVFAEGAGTFDIGLASLTVASPYFGDRAPSVDPRGVKVQPSLGIFTQGAVVLAGTTAAAPVVAQAPGATLKFGSIDRPVASFSAVGITLRASAGIIDVRATGDIMTSGSTVIATPGYAKTFGDAADPVIVSAPGGYLSLVSLRGDVALGSETRLIIGGGNGSAGTLQLSAALGKTVLPGIIDAAAPEGRASLRLDSGTAAFDLAGFLAGQGKAFTGDIRIRTGTGNLVLNAGQTLRADSLRLIADGGLVDIAGTVDTSGINGGAIGLFGVNGVTLRSAALLDAHANGYAADDTRAATGGLVEIGTTGNGAIIVSNGARIDVAARRPGARLISQIRKDAQTLNDTLTYNYAQSDTGGIVAFRAPVVLDGAQNQTVNIAYAGSIAGAREISVEGFRTYDLSAMANAGGCAGADICINALGQAVLDLNAAPKTNRLASTAAGSIPDFIRKFDLSASATGLGALAADPVFHARPGVELAYAGDIILASNWNLAAATVNVGAAIADGLMATSPQLGSGYTYVVPGKEAELFSGFSASAKQFYTDFIYRVGGRANGEAGVLTLRAGGNLDIRGSITDGFFNFADATDSAYLSFQLGGGDRQYRPALQFSCAGPVGSCADLFTPFEFAPGAVTPPVALIDGVSIIASRLTRGQGIADLLGAPVAPYSAAANTPGALGAQAGGAGDPIGSASIMPLLADGRAAASFSLRLVGGATAPGASKLPVSADPLSVAAASAGVVSVSGDSSYRAAPIVIAQKYAGDLELFNADPNFGTSVSAPPGNFIEALGATGVVLDPSAYTRLTLTGASPTIRTFFVTAARAYFAANKIPTDQYQFFGPATNPTSLATSADLMARFLQSISSGFADRIGSPGFNYAAPVLKPATTLDNPNIAVRSLVRTGTGSIDVAAAGDVDLTNGRPVFRAANGRVVSSGAVSGAQVGGAAIYTIGHVVDPAAQAATSAASGTVLSVDPAYLAAKVANSYLPNLQGVLGGEPVYASGGGDIRIASGRDVLARRDAWSESFRGKTTTNPPTAFANAGTDTQLWRSVSAADASQRFVPITNIRINAQLFSTGVGALGGGSVRVEAARNISELTAVSDTSITTGQVTDASKPTQAPALTLISYGGGNVDVRAGRDVLGSQVDVASGSLRIIAGGSIASAGTLRLSGTAASPTAALEQNLLRVRVADATATVSAIKSVTIGGVASTDGEGFFGRTAGVSVLTNGDVLLTNTGKDIRSQFSQANDTNATLSGALLPGSLQVSALFGDIDLSDTSLLGTGARRAPIVLVPSQVGQLRLFAGGSLASVTLVMDDGDPSLTPGPLSALTQALLQDVNNINVNTRRFGVPVILPTTSDADRRRLHNERATHIDDAQPVRVVADGDINQLSLFVPKQARISAGGDIVDMVFVGQNLNANDVTRITAGRDIVASSRVLAVQSATGTANLPVLQGNNFVLGGPGALFVEAGRDLGPFFNSATVRDGDGRSITYGGGILTIGNDYNPWLQPVGAKLYAQFGVGKGADYVALRSAYVDPANRAALDGDLFVQAIDANGNRTPNRAKPVYDMALVGWLVENQPAAIVAAFGAPISLAASEVVPLLDSLDVATRTQFLTDLPFLAVGGGIPSPLLAIDRSIETAPVLITGAFAAQAPTAQQTSISGSTLIGWLAQNAPAVLTAKYRLASTDINRAYAQLTALPQLTQRQFLLDRVYFNELAAPSRPNGASSGQFVRGYRAVDKLFPGASGYTANDLGGTVNGGSKVSTGNLDLRLAALETQRGGDITILGPGGRVLGGSIVATSAQASRRGSNVQDPFNLFRGTRRQPVDNALAARIFGIPTGYEGVLTLRGGSVRGFTDGDFLLNQSRLFTIAGGDITLWSSNGDLNAGQGVKTTANNPPVVVRFDPNGVGVLDQAGAVAGAGIAGFTPADGSKSPDITLVAPVGTVDAGDAGVRASGNVFVAAARVANADNFKVGGTAFGNIAATTVDTGAAASANAASAAASQAAAAVNPSSGRTGDDRARISVEVLGFAGNADEDPCNLPAGQRPTNCPVTQN